MITTFHPRYAIAWKWKSSSSNEWRLWMCEDREEGMSNPIAIFQWYSDSDHRLPNALDYMNKHVARPEVECKIVEVDMQVWNVKFEQQRGLVRGEQLA